MNKIAILDNSSVLSLEDGSELIGSGIYSSGFISELNSKAKNVEYCSDYINEIFIYFEIKIKEHEKIFGLNKIDQIQSFGKKLPWHIVFAAKNAGIRISKYEVFMFYMFSGFLCFVSIIAVLFSSFIFPLFAIFKRTRKLTGNESDFTIIRSPASLSKLKYLQIENEVLFYYDDLFKLKANENSMYSSVSLLEKIYSLFSLPFLSLLDFIKLSKDIIGMFGYGPVGYVQFHYALKITHKCMYQIYLSKIAKRHRAGEFITAHKEDRFAVVDAQTCKKESIKSICIPHGLEYSFYVPTGLPGDVFYCTTEKSAKHLNKLYTETKFVFDKEIATKMFSVNKKTKESKRMIFFTEAIGTNVNVTIIRFLIDAGFKFYLKLHPKDKKSNYKDLSDGFEYIEDFAEAISNNICLARKSTVLVEALYNNSVPIAVVIDSIDKSYVECLIPSLLDEKISRVATTNELHTLLKLLQYNECSIINP